MSRDVFQKFITRRSTGAVVEGAQVTVNIQGGGLATIFDSQSGGAQLPNPFTTGADGLARFFAAPGFYEVSVFVAGEGTATFVWNNLGDNNLREDVGTAAFADIQTSPTDATAGRGLIQGAWALGGATAAPLTEASEWQDARNIPTQAIRVIGSQNPFTGNASLVLNFRYDESGNGGRGFQIWGETAGTSGLNQFYGRCTDNNGWQAFQRFYTTRNILGTVSQSGGVPTGAIIQRGSNANGEFVRYADGTQICTRNVTDFDPNNQDPDRNYATPVSFIEAPTASVSMPGTNELSRLTALNRLVVMGDTAFWRLNVVETTNESFIAGLRLVAIGRWF